MGVIGAILGDIAGSRWEFAAMLPQRKDYSYQLFSPSNYFTDDTVLSIACMDAMQNKKLFRAPNFSKYYNIWGNKYKTAGYGGSFVNWLKETKKKPYNSFGNGSAMRCSYIGEISTTLKECDKLAELSAKCTHNHPEGIKGAVVLARCVYMAEHGSSKEDILKYSIEQYPPVSPENMRFSKHGDIDGKYVYSPAVPTREYKDTITYQISCQGSVPVAIRCFYETNSFEECMYLINSMNIDTDTVGAIAGAICHSFYKKCTDQDDELLNTYLPDEMLWKLFWCTRMDRVISRNIN